MQDVGWTVGGAVILADISLQIARGELLAVIGPNGAGKSSLVNMISGVTRPTAGRILLNGRMSPGCRCGCGRGPASAAPSRRRRCSAA